jgi:hypothetical protein
MVRRPDPGRQLLAFYPHPASDLPATLVIVGASLACLGAAYVLRGMAPSVISVEFYVAISGMLITAMAIAALYRETRDFRWKQIYTAKNMVLVGCLIFLAAGALSSAFVTHGYVAYPESTVIRTASWFVIGTASFLAGARSRGSRIGELLVRPLTASAPRARVWLGVLVFFAIAIAGYVRGMSYFNPRGETNPWDHLTEFLTIAGVLLFAVFLRKSSSPVEKFWAGLLLCPIVLRYATIWSRRPLQSVAVAGLAYYCLNRRLDRMAQIRLAVVLAVLGLLQTLAQGWYRGFVSHEQLSARYADTYVEEMQGPVRSGTFFGTFDEACTSIYYYPEKHGYLYGESFYALLVNPIPRRLWPDKPVGYGYTLGQAVFHRNIPVSTFGASLVAELFANGGGVAVILGMVLLGFLCNAYDSALLGQFKTESSLLIHALGLYQFLFLVRGDFLDAGYKFLITVVPLFLLLSLPAPVMEAPRPHWRRLPFAKDTNGGR